MAAPVESIAQTIQLAVTPVFLLTAIGTVLAVLTTRLGRVVDRARELEDLLMGDASAITDEQRRIALSDLSVLDKRMATVNGSIVMCTASGFLVCIVIAILFVGELINTTATQAIIWLFLGALGLLAAGLGMFLIEVRIALTSVRVRAGLMALARPASARRGSQREA